MKRSDWIYIVVIAVLLVIIFQLVQDNRKKDAALVALSSTVIAPAPAYTSVPVTPVPQISTATVAPSPTPVPTATLIVTPTVTLAPMATNKPFATEAPNLAITPIGGALYDVTGTVNALGCPDTRCKVIDVYKKRSIVVVTGTVMGTTYKKEKTRLWYQVVFHDGRKVYVHGAFLTPHVKAILRQATATATP